MSRFTTTTTLDPLPRITLYQTVKRHDMHAHEEQTAKLRDLVCTAFDVTWEQIRSKTRKHPIVFARHAYVYISFKLFTHKKPATIANEIAHERSGVYNNVEAMQKLIDTNHENMREVIANIINEMK
jgi:chromosomal replication initiation ATPase DnaA